MTEWYEAMERSLDWIEAHITEDFALSDLAGQAGYSPFYFSRLFRAVVGTTIKKYVADRRLCRAALAIRDTRQRLLDIALQYGFSSQEAMTRAFKAAFGLTPRVFRQNPYRIALSGRPAVSYSEKTLEKRNGAMQEHLEQSKQILDGFTTKTGFARKMVGINIVSSDPRRLAYFYRDVLGADLCEDHGGPHRIEIWFGERNENTTWITVNYDEGFQPQTFNACQGFEFRVADADAEYKRIRTLGVLVDAPPKDLPWGCRFFHIKDPDGNGIDIVQAL